MDDDLTSSSAQLEPTPPPTTISTSNIDTTNAYISTTDKTPTSTLATITSSVASATASAVPGDVIEQLPGNPIVCIQCIISSV